MEKGGKVRERDGEGMGNDRERMGEEWGRVGEEIRKGKRLGNNGIGKAMG